MAARFLRAALLPCAAVGVHANHTHGRAPAHSPFLLVSGATAPAELCLVVESGKVGTEGAAVALQECAAAIAAADGRESWQLQGNGQLANPAGEKCVSLAGSGASEGSRVVLADCAAALGLNDGRSQWEMLGSGQWKVASVGDLCLSQSGVAPGVANVAARAASSASSAASSLHGADRAVDGHAATYWASATATLQPVTFVVDFGERFHLHDIDITWEFPAKAFSISLSSDGERFSEAFSTDVNSLMETHVPLGADARAAKLTMIEAHPTLGVANGRHLFGIKSIAAHAPRVSTIVEPCARAASSKDARDKYFAVSVGAAVQDAGRRLWAEVPALEAARAALAAVASEVSVAVAALPGCSAVQGAVLAFSNASAAELRAGSAAPAPSRGGIVAAAGAPDRVNEALRGALGFDGVELLVAAARSGILGIRKVLN